MSIGLLSITKAQKFDIEKSRLEQDKIRKLGLDSLISVANKLSIAKEYMEAAMVFSRVLQQDKSRSDLRVYVLAARGTCKRMLGDNRGAIKDCEESLSIDVYLFTYASFPNDALEILSLSKEMSYKTMGLCKIALGEKNEGCLDLSSCADLGDATAYDLIREYCK